MRKSWSTVTTVVSGLITLAGCATPYQFYEGSALPVDRIAAIVSSPSSATRELLADKLNISRAPYSVGPPEIYEIDGKRKPGQVRYNESSAFQFSIQMLPGKHSLSLGPAARELLGSKPILIEFIAEAGHTYYLGKRIEPLDTRISTWYPILVDETTNTIIRPLR